MDEIITGTTSTPDALLLKTGCVTGAFILTFRHPGLLHLFPQRFPAPHLVEHHRVHLSVRILCRPHDDV